MSASVTGAAAGGIGGAICVWLARSALDQGLPAKIVACVTGTNPGLAALANELRLMGAAVFALTGIVTPETSCINVEAASEAGRRRPGRWISSTC